MGLSSCLVPGHGHGRARRDPVRVDGLGGDPIVRETGAGHGIEPVQPVAASRMFTESMPVVR
ncbi:hypothetical protein [Streptomyces sp. NBC_01353]|uniref:hypothetical protein n=1 Tax=Streptomyces sp. NBC_01353 TaxID=2903835 RepID=UPI002E367EC3|nr:hypothetical protein [Streptomyces sp. NBC_01353]